ncbi:glycosyltransferase [Ramlibacter ginsenosidimutans]|uniref:Glycosyltransferase n=1 Tax=Ramlibacter ginsenosidimutans TaxID=502333 RepID=A0A934TP38_9BURK|nr:glycosyltransferase [Ramlibacter ginsenosidimutans]MBK6004585.1 glycosyltransferase [Ramlibacter ginsenosidimutans]
MKTSLDACVVRDNRVFAYGWAFDGRCAVAQLRLRVTLADRRSVMLPVVAQKERRDVAEAFPTEPHAGHSGWLVYGAWEGAQAVALALVGVLENGEEFTCALAVDGLRAGDAAWDAGDFFRRLSRRARMWVRGDRRAKPQADGGATPEVWMAELRAALHARGSESCPLVFDHSMGGGASGYSAGWISQHLRDRPLVLVLSFEIASLRYTLELRSAHGVARIFHFITPPADALAGSGIVDEVLYNDAVSFPRPECVPDWLLAFRAQPGTTLHVVIHDYLAVCPSQFLLNDAGRFCGVPDLVECTRCLPRNDNEFARLFPPASMPVWREAWGRALAAADTITCFSASSESLLRRAYPALVPGRIRVHPHAVEGFDALPVVDLSAPLHIGVVGAIGWHKGAGVLKELAEEIVRRSLPVKITVIGSVYARCDASVVRSTGPFSRDDLPRLISGSGANVFLLPSICPETFSYVTQELIMLGVPLACFDFGAPADRVGTYCFGRVLPRGTAADLLDRLLRFHQDIADQHAELA